MSKWLLTAQPMLRTVRSSDSERLIEIWLEAVCAAHPSVQRAHWEAQIPALRSGYLARDDSWVYLQAGQERPEGFLAAMNDGKLGLLVVAPDAQGQGVGSELMAQAKRGRPQLTVSLLEENLRARYFCQKHGFVETERQLCRDTGQAQLLMSYRV